MHARRFPASPAERLDNFERMLWLPSAEVISAVALRSGEVIAGVVAGTGYFSLPLASAVGAQSKIYAVDGQAEMAHRIASTDAFREMRLAGFERHATAEGGKYSCMVQCEKVQ